MLFRSLLAGLLAEDFFCLPPPKSTGRDLFHLGWLDARLVSHVGARPQDIQATLAMLTARSVAQAIRNQTSDCEAVFVCGGGAFNDHLMNLLSRELSLPVSSTAALGVSPSHVEALAFAWLAQRFCERQPGNLPAVTGAKGDRILGALYPA